MEAIKGQIKAIHSPCVVCAEKTFRHVSCHECHASGLCNKCRDYCVVKAGTKPIITAKDRLERMKAGTMGAAAAVKARIQKKPAADGADGNTAEVESVAIADDEPTEEGGLQGEKPTAGPLAEEEDYPPHMVCRLCFRKSVERLDLAVDHEVIEPEEPSAGPPITLVALHGGGHSRAQFRKLATDLVAAFPKQAEEGAGALRVVIMDLPGHGSRMDEPVTKEACVRAIGDIIERVVVPLEQAADNGEAAPGVVAPGSQGDDYVEIAAGARARAPADSKATQPMRVLLGSSFGGFVGMEFLGRYPALFDGAIILSAGMALGAGHETPLIGKLAVAIGQRAVKAGGSGAVARGFLRGARGNKETWAALDKQEFSEAILEPGLYFHNHNEQVATLNACDTKRIMGRFHGPIIYLDGAYANTLGGGKKLVLALASAAVENEMLAESPDTEEAEATEGDAAPEKDTAVVLLSRAIHYPTGNRFFMNDTRTKEEAGQDIALFLVQLAKRGRRAVPEPKAETADEVVVEEAAAPKPLEESAETKTDEVVESAEKEETKEEADPAANADDTAEEPANATEETATEETAEDANVEDADAAGESKEEDAPSTSNKGKKGKGKKGKQ